MHLKIPLSLFSTKASFISHKIINYGSSLHLPSQLFSHTYFSRKIHQEIEVSEDHVYILSRINLCEVLLNYIHHTFSAREIGNIFKTLCTWNWSNWISGLLLLICQHQSDTGPWESTSNGPVFCPHWYKGPIHSRNLEHNTSNNN